MEVKRATEELRSLFQNLPVGFPEGADSVEGNYEHLLLIPLEYEADRRVFGELRALEIMEFWSTDHYTRLYRIVLDKEHRATLESILKKHHLFPTRDQP